VYTIALDASIAAGQVETIHFHYLLESNGGFVRAAPGLDEHVRDLAEGVHGRFDHDRMRAFIERFVRPGGLSQAATPLFVHEIEALESEATRAREVAEKRLRKQALKSGLIPVASEAVISPAESGVEPRRELSSSTVTQERRVMVDYPRDAIWITVSTPMEQRWRAKTCAKEPFTVDWIERELRDNDVFYDIGANVGVFSLIAARRTRGLTAVAFEPGYASYARLCDNIVLNACDHSIIPIPLPLADRTGLAGFKYRSLHAGQSRHTLMDSGIGRQKEKASPRYTQPVLAMRLDDVVSQFELPAPTHIKLDVDGAELRVLHGASKTLKHSGLKTIFAEVDRPLWDEVTHLLAAAGFRMAERHARETKKPDAPYYGFFTR
jgi:FkbM family methyltransferase